MVTVPEPIFREPNFDEEPKMENLYEPLIKLIEEKQKIIQMILDSDGPTKPGSQRTIRLKGNLEGFNTVIELINKINQ